MTLINHFEMDYSTKLLKFQITKLGYQFRNLYLLSKALTHSLNESDINPHFQALNRTNHRLAVVGETVLKLVTREYVIRTSKSVREYPGEWTVRNSALLDLKSEIGIKLLENDILDEIKSGVGIVRIHIDNWTNSKFQVPYSLFLNAVFGAIYLDSCESSHYGTKQCFKVFLKLWQPYFPQDVNINRLENYFPPPVFPITKYWREKGLRDKTFTINLRKLLGFDTFTKWHCYSEAIIHFSFYNDLDTTEFAYRNSRKPNYERLEFLGDAVLDTILAEYFWRNHTDDNATRLSIQISWLAQNTYQQQIYQNLDLGYFVKCQKQFRWSGQGDIVEALIGAIFVDKGYNEAKKFVCKHWNLLRRPKTCKEIENL